MLTSYTLENLTEDVKTALKAGAHFSALALTFALVSECASITYPDEWFDKNADTDEYMKRQFPYLYKNGRYTHPGGHDKERFIMWLDDWENSHNCDDSIKAKMEEYERNTSEFRKATYGISPHINGELLYQLRCSLFHEASNKIDFLSKRKISDEGNMNIDSTQFTLSLDKYNPYEVHMLESSSTWENGKSSMDISVNGLIYHLLNYIEIFWENIDKKACHTIRVHDNR